MECQIVPTSALKTCIRARNADPDPHCSQHTKNNKYERMAFVNAFFPAPTWRNCNDIITDYVKTTLLKTLFWRNNVVMIAPYGDIMMSM